MNNIGIEDDNRCRISYAAPLLCSSPVPQEQLAALDIDCLSIGDNRNDTTSTLPILGSAGTGGISKIDKKRYSHSRALSDSYHHQHQYQYQQPYDDLYAEHSENINMSIIASIEAHNNNKKTTIPIRRRITSFMATSTATLSPVASSSSASINTTAVNINMASRRPHRVPSSSPHLNRSNRLDNRININKPPHINAINMRPTSNLPPMNE